MFRVSDLRNKDIINTLNGKRLGPIKDIEVDMQAGKITAIVLPSPYRFLGIFARGEGLVVSWDQIRKIGIDVVLVEVQEALASKKLKENYHDSWLE